VGSSTGAGRLVADVRPAGLHAAVPLPYGSRLLLGLDRRFSQDFDVWSESLEQTEYRYHITGRGGLQALRVGLAGSLLDAACVGVEYNRLLGAAREDWRLELPGYGYSSTDTVELDYSANTFRLGASFRLSGLGLGLFYEPPLVLGARSFRRVNGVVEDSIIEHRLRLPSVLAGAASFAPSARFLVVAGLDYRPWSGITVGDTALAGACDAIGASFGAEFFVGRIPARCGYSYRQWYYAAGNGDALDEHRLHVGAGIPVPGFGSVNLCLEAARRTAGGLEETAGRLGLTLAYHEAWLQRTRRWGY